jgi:acetolactate synthase-1/2/3 large subunit
VVGRNFNWVRDVTVSNSTWGNRELRIFEPSAGVHATGGGIGRACRWPSVRRWARPPRVGPQDILPGGDGGFILNLGELATLVQEKADCLIVLMNDQRYGVIQNIQDAPTAAAAATPSCTRRTTRSCAHRSGCRTPA